MQPQQDQQQQQQQHAEGDDYFRQRCQTIQRLREEGVLVPHPHKFTVTLEIGAFRARYDPLLTENGVDLPSEEVALAGRITAKRSSSAKLFFYVLHADGSEIQVLCNFVHYSEQERFVLMNETVLRRGDVVGVVGFPARSKTGELSIVPRRLVLLAPCYHSLPHGDTLSDIETRYRSRHLDLIVNTRMASIFRTRARIIAFVRAFYDARGYVEVETPMMSLLPGGANAKPFVTHHNDMHTNMFMRIAPELFLKQCVIGGLSRVYEIGKNFRNESADLTHNPEYTAIETYCAYDDYEDVMRTTEELLSSLVREIAGGYLVPYVLKSGEKCTIDFTPPFRRVPLMRTLSETLGVTFPVDIASQEMHDFLVALLAERGLRCEPATTAKMLDTLVGEYIEPSLINPGFITDHPQIMSPLAKWHRVHAGLTERFELFVAGRELCNAYTELNDPFRQRATFQSEARGRAAGDDEAQPIDEPFCVALEYGLPPTAGFGMGIDRLCMLLTQQTSIKEVILFPAMRPLEADREAQAQLATTVRHVAARMAERA